MAPFIVCLNIFDPYIDDSVAVEDPHDTGTRVAGDTAAETSPFAFHHLDILGLQDEDGLLLLHLSFGPLVGHSSNLEKINLNKYFIQRSQISNNKKLPLPGGFHFADHFHALHSLGQLGIVDDAFTARRLDEGLGFIHAVLVGGSADVLAAVLWVDPTEIHGNVTEIVDGSESRLVGQRFAVEEPFDAHVGIANRSQLAFEFGHFHFLELHHVLDLSDESRRLSLIGVVDVVFRQENL